MGLIASSVVSDILFKSDLERKITDLLASYGLPIRINKSFYNKTSFDSKESLLDKLVDIAFTDKKGIDGCLRIILLKEIYHPVIYSTNNRKLIREGFNSILETL